MFHLLQEHGASRSFDDGSRIVAGYCVDSDAQLTQSHGADCCGAGQGIRRDPASGDEYACVQQPG
jgi:hypothetical protein